MLIQCATKAIGNIIFSVRKCTCTSKTAHNRTGFATDTGFYLFSVNRAFSIIKRISCLKYCDFKFRLFQAKLICRKNSAWSCTDYYNVVFHFIFSLLIVLPFIFSQYSFAVCSVLLGPYS